MRPEQPKRKRATASCTQCYSKKQKCNHEFPCNHCTRRRQPELCSYDTAEIASFIAQPRETIETRETADTTSHQLVNSLHTSNALVDGESHTRRSSTSESGTMGKRPSTQTALSPRRQPPGEFSGDSGFASCLGYFKGGRSSFLSLVQDFHLIDEEQADLPNGQYKAVIPKFNELFRLFPKRFVMDLLIQYFFAEVNWIYEMVHSTSFLLRYQNWWTSNPAHSFEGLEFAVLLLRLGAYSTQFLPSQAHPADHIKGIPLSSIREHCYELATKLWNTYESLDPPRTLTSAHQMFFQTCYLKNEGRVKDAWYTLGSTVRLAQDLGLHLEQSAPMSANINELEKEMRRRAFWNLYMWDRFLSLTLDRPPCISDDYCIVDLPKMRLGISPDADPANTPHSFLERMLSIQLTKLWYSMHSTKMKSMSYDPIMAQQIYQRLQDEFIAMLPPSFRLTNPSTQWDSEMPFLPRQRCMLRISVFILLCHLFRPLLQLTSSQISSLPFYKRNLLPLQSKYLVNAAFSVLDSISSLHQLMGNRPTTRFFFLSFYTFEPAMLLGLYLLSKKQFSRYMSDASERDDRDLLSEYNTISSFATAIAVKPPNDQKCREALDNARQRLSAFSDHSPIAKIGGRKLDEVIGRINAFYRVSANGSVALEDGTEGEARHNMQSSSQSGTDGNGWLGLDRPQEPQLTQELPHDLWTPLSLFNGTEKNFTSPFDGSNAAVGATSQPFLAAATYDNQWTRGQNGLEYLFGENGNTHTIGSNGGQDPLYNNSASPLSTSTYTQLQSLS